MSLCKHARFCANWHAHLQSLMYLHEVSIEIKCTLKIFALALLRLSNCKKKFSFPVQTHGRGHWFNGTPAVGFEGEFTKAELYLRVKSILLLIENDFHFPSIDTDWKMQILKATLLSNYLSPPDNYVESQTFLALPSKVMRFQKANLP